MVICQETPSHGKKIYGNLTAARHAPSKKVRYTRYYRFLRCAFLSVKQNYGKIRPRRAAVVCLPMSNLFSISKILSVTIGLTPREACGILNGTDYTPICSLLALECNCRCKTALVINSPLPSWVLRQLDQSGFGAHCIQGVATSLGLLLLGRANCRIVTYGQ